MLRCFCHSFLQFAYESVIYLDLLICLSIELFLVVDNYFVDKLIEYISIEFLYIRITVNYFCKFIGGIGSGFERCDLICQFRY